MYIVYQWCILLYPPQRSWGGVYWIHPVRPSVRPSVCLSVRPSVRPWVGVRMITLILFSGFKIFFFTYITWVKILHGIEYQRPTSLNMRILADHVTYSFLAFMKSIFHFCLGCYCGGYSQSGRSNLSSCPCVSLIHCFVVPCRQFESDTSFCYRITWKRWRGIPAKRMLEDERKLWMLPHENCDSFSVMGLCKEM